VTQNNVATLFHGLWLDQIDTKFGTNQRYFILSITSYFIWIKIEKQGGAIYQMTIAIIGDEVLNSSVYYKKKVFNLGDRAN